MKCDLEEVKSIQLKILEEVHRYCKKNNIQYYMAYGTLLGAVRHKGYIPWDDDIDIVMFRKDYEFFVKNFNKNRNDELEVLHSSIDKLFPYEFAKIHNKKTAIVEAIGVHYDMGINIDLFVLDDIGNDRQNAFYLEKKLKWFKKALNWKFILSNKEKQRPLYKRIAVSILKKLADKHDIDFYTNRIDQLSNSNNRGQSKYVACLSQRWFSDNEILEKDWFKDSILLEFEGKSFFAPVKYDEVLSTNYGNYMELPKKKDRVTHHDYVAYKK